MLYSVADPLCRSRSSRGIAVCSLRDPDWPIPVSRSLLTHVLLCSLWISSLWISPASLMAQESQGPERWEKTIQALEQRDRTDPDPAGAILFVGSSSIRLWETMAEQMAPYPTIRRGYGGAKFDDVDHYAKRLIYPHRPRAIVFFVGNDVSGAENDKSPEQVVALVDSIVGKIRAKHAETPIFFIEVTPTNRRWAVWPKIRAVNAALAEYCSDNHRVHLISTAGHFLNQEGKPIGELFRDDQLHLNSDGYALWTKIIKRRLNQVLQKETK